MEIIRFALLLTMTVALISVATRHGDDSSSRNQAARGHPSVSASASPAGGQTSAPGRGGSPSPSSQQPSKASATPAPTATSKPSHAGGSGEEAGVATLPRTGGTQAVDLAGLAVLFIAAGSFGMRVSRPRVLVAQAEWLPTAAAAHEGQTPWASESNRPGTV